MPYSTQRGFCAPAHAKNPRNSLNKLANMDSTTGTTGPIFAFATLASLQYLLCLSFAESFGNYCDLMLKSITRSYVVVQREARIFFINSKIIDVAKRRVAAFQNPTSL
jgi:hypothetical protein